LSLKVHQLAKELGIESRAILEKLAKEGIEKPAKHTDAVSAGLTETIREWFHAGELKTAIETTEHVDVAKLKPARKRGGKKGAAASEDGGTSMAVAEPPVNEMTPVVEAPEQEPAPAPVVEAPVEAPAVVETPAPAAPVAPVVPVAEAPVAPPPPPPAPVAPAPVAAPAAPAKPAAPVAPVKPVAPVLHKPVKPVKPMGIPNVPTRPTIVGPVGPRVQPAPAQLKGPQVIRVEKPDNLPAPRARFERPGGPGRGPGGFTPGGPPMAMPGTGVSRGGPGRRDGGRGGAAPVDDEETAAKKKARSTRRGGQGRRGDAGVELIREWRELDLLEREERLASASGSLRERRREMNKQVSPRHNVPASRPTQIELAPPVTIRELSEAMGVKSSDIVRKLMQQGVMATVNQALENDAAMTIALEFGVELTVKAAEKLVAALEREYKAQEDAAEKQLRPAVVTILGHVDHGKTSLLDKIRSANVAAGEAGGITQHVGAYTVTVAGSDGKEKRVTFLDTPGHQAFTAMRARGANMTDVVVLVVAADDGVMPQTIESINHAKAAGVPIVVAMNKIDKAEANPNRVLGQLAEHGLNPTEWGGDIEVVKTSAVSGQGVKELIEYLDYVATLRDLKAAPQMPARGAVVESFMDANRGVIARVLVQNGTLRIGDVVICGSAWGRVRSLIDDKGKAIKEAGPAAPVEVIGLDVVPAAGDRFYVVEDSAKAQEIAEEQRQTTREEDIAKRTKVTLENLYDTMKLGDVKELRVILKADVQGSVDVLRQLLNEELSKEVKVKLLHSAVGAISESDVVLAEASDAIIIGFSVVPDETARKMAEDRGVEIRTYRIIYEITDDIRKALTGMLSPSKQDQVLGHAEIRKIIKVSRIGNVCGCIVTDGTINRSSKYRLIRDGAVVTENLTLESLKRLKDDVKEVRSGMECGLKLAGYDDVKMGDRLEAYKTVDVARTL